jgi:hypothetical protein
VADQSTSWQPDPFGAHEFRFFSADGKPTLLVMDGGKTSYDRPPTTRPPAAPEPSSTPGSEAPPAAPFARSPLAPPPTVVDPDEVATGPSTHSTQADAEDSVADRGRPRTAAPTPTYFADDRSAQGVERGKPEPLSRSLKIAYGVVFVALALSALGLVYVHLGHTGSAPSTHAEGTTTTSSAPRTTTTVALPTALQPGAEAAATALVSSCATGNKPAALTVATPAAVTALFAVPYASGLAIDRGCSSSFTPIVCTFGPPGGASPTDPIYEIDVSQASGGWYVSSVKIEN